MDKAETLELQIENNDRLPGYKKLSDTNKLVDDIEGLFKNYERQQKYYIREADWRKARQGMR